MKAEARVAGVQIRRIRFYAALLPVMTAALVGGIAGAATSGVVRYVIIATCTGVGALGVGRSLQLDFRADEHGAVVTNFWRTYRFTWSDVELVRHAYLAVGVVPQTAIAFWVKGRRPVLAQATPIGQAAREEAFRQIARRAAPGTPVGPDAKRN